MPNQHRKLIAFFVLAGIGAQSARAHGPETFIPILVALPLGQLLALLILVIIAWKQHRGFIASTIIICCSLLTSVLVWVSKFPLIEIIFTTVPNNFAVSNLIFFFYGLVTSIAGGLLAGWAWKQILLQHNSSFGIPPE